MIDASGNILNIGQMASFNINDELKHFAEECDKVQQLYVDRRFTADKLSNYVDEINYNAALAEEFHKDGCPKLRKFADDLIKKSGNNIDHLREEVDKLYDKYCFDIPMKIHGYF